MRRRSGEFIMREALIERGGLDMERGNEKSEGKLLFIITSSLYTSTCVTPS
jgi:hypothetical protein